jgi:hypothetical protein
MKNMNAAALKQDIKNQNEVIRGIRNDINSLKWKAGGIEELAKVRQGRELTRGTNYPSPGKKDLKPFHRPETGPARYALWDNKRLEGDTARYLMLAYVALRGRTYQSMEALCVAPRTAPRSRTSSRPSRSMPASRLAPGRGQRSPRGLLAAPPP